jgi:peptide deformylase
VIITDEKSLRVKCVDALPGEVVSIIEQLDNELLHETSLGRPGIGLAAPQCGIHKNIAIIRINDHLKIDLVNCKIVAKYDQYVFENEGCLSFPGMFEKTLRYNEIYVEGNDVEPNRFIATGLFAVAIQHEIDHLNGILLPDVAIKTKQNKLRPNDLCSCKSGKKYKKCCGKE